MDTRKWTFANVVLVRGQSYSIGSFRFLPGRTVKVTDVRLVSLIRGNPAFSIEDHWLDEQASGLSVDRAVQPFATIAPKPVPAAPKPNREEPVSPSEDFPPPFAPASGVPVGAFVVTTESKPAGKKVLKKQTKIEE